MIAFSFKKLLENLLQENFSVFENERKNLRVNVLPPLRFPVIEYMVGDKIGFSVGKGQAMPGAVKSVHLR